MGIANVYWMTCAVLFLFTVIFISRRVKEGRDSVVRYKSNDRTRTRRDVPKEIERMFPVGIHLTQTTLPEVLPSPEHTRRISLPPPEHTRRISLPPPEHTRRISLPPPEHTRRISLSPPEHTRRISLPPPEHTRRISLPTPVIPPDTAPVRTQGASAYDPQNSHDHFVSTALHRSVDSIMGNRGQRPSVVDCERAIASAMSYITEPPDDADFSPDEAQKAASAMEGLPGSVHESIGFSPLEVFCAVWERVSSVKPSSEMSNCRENLVKQLSTAIENGMCVCSQGMISRLVSSIEGTPASTGYVSIDRKHVLSSISSMAAAVRQRVLSASDPSDRERYESGASDTLVVLMEKELEREAHSAFENYSSRIVSSVVKEVTEGFR